MYPVLLDPFCTDGILHLVKCNMNVSIYSLRLHNYMAFTVTISKQCRH